jgi:hypothetical protein
MDEARRTVDHTPQDFLAAWWRGKAGPVPCAGCSACCYYAGIPVDKKRDRSRLPHLLTERNHDGELVLQRRADGALRSPGRAGLRHLRAPTIGLSQLRLPRLLSHRLSRALRS